MYAVSAVLFNHPQLYSDRIEATFGKEGVAGTPMESPPAPADLANQVIAALRERNPSASYALIEPEKARYFVDSAVAMVRADGQNITVLVNLTGQGGYMRAQPTPPPRPAEEKAPFAVGGAGNNDMRDRRAEGRPAPAPRSGDAVRFAQPLEERVQAAVPTLLGRYGFPRGKVSVTFMPDLTFLMSADDKIWKVKYHFQTGSVSGESPDADVLAAKSVSPAQFLTRLHVARGYPSEVNLQWWWASIVDAMAGIMVFWGFSGLLMWWQIKRTRRLGVLGIAHVVADQEDAPAGPGRAGPQLGGGHLGRRRDAQPDDNAQVIASSRPPSPHSRSARSAKSRPGHTIRSDELLDSAQRFDPLMTARDIA